MMSKLESAEGKAMTLTKADHIEVMDRIHCAQEMIDALISLHKVVSANPRIEAEITDATSALARAYQMIGQEEMKP